MPKTLEDLMAAPPPPVAGWYTITNEAAGGQSRALVRIYDAIGGWFGTNAAEFVQELDALDVDELAVHINSPGGAVWDGIAIMNALKAHRARVTVVVDGLAASAASIVAMAGDEIVMAEGSQMMIHRASGGAWGNADFMRDTAGVLDKIDQNLAGIYARRAGGSSAGWLDVMRAETWYNADEAVAAGLADRADATAEAVDVEAAFDLSRFTFAGRSKAPAPRSVSVLRAVALTTPQSPASSEPGNTNPKEGPMASDSFMAGLRERLGITDAGLGEDGVLAALDEVLTEQSDHPAGISPAAASTQPVPDGTVLVDAVQFAELQREAAAGVQLRAEQDSARRAQLCDAAVADGRVAPVNRGIWRARLDENEEGTVALLSTLPTNMAIPADPIGYVGGEEASTEDAIYSKLFPRKDS